MPKKIKARSSSKQDGSLKLETYIHKILKQVRPDLGISTKAIQQVNGVLVGQLEKMTDLATATARAGKKSTLSARHVQAAVNVHLPPELAKHAVAEGTKAVAKFVA
jgi:histone H2B|tara:strand:+ start:92 stop:409 length:318 start_codon:yes stop_codon:yes gene_type:complete